ncbi:hypothetical protein GIB67_041094 [Kingdonia uniflora]|uniref:WRKY domain-containing protein n=1 Tax=Kingdonia uniflora TaxID=39325 RepID=A0A7J7LK42_9MAGN|nr:hypothetical protein GIB67_041094 [Kingdonia uniflora]
MDRQRETEELMKGREYTIQLQKLIKELNLGGEISSSVEELVLKVIHTFTDALTLVNSCKTEAVCLTSTTAAPVDLDDGLREEHVRKRKINDSMIRMGGSKRRKTMESWTKETLTPINDGHAWRKYGQKQILNAKNPRNYFRCTHKKDLGCLAQKQVQITEEDPAMYRTIYIGHHTCKDIKKEPEHILASLPKNPNVLNLEPKIISKHDDPFFSSFPMIHYEYYNDEMSADLTTLDSSDPTAFLASSAESDNGDSVSGLYSCSPSSPNWDMDLVMGSCEFDDVLHGFF